MSDETPIVFEENERAMLALSVLREGPASTVDLIAAGLIHPARQIWELRHWYGRQVNTSRGAGHIAIYELTGHCR